MWISGLNEQPCFSKFSPRGVVYSVVYKVKGSKWSILCKQVDEARARSGLKIKYSEKVRQKAKIVSIWPFRTADRKIHQLDWNLNKNFGKGR